MVHLLFAIADQRFPPAQGNLVSSTQDCELALRTGRCLRGNWRKFFDGNNPPLSAIEFHNGVGPGVGAGIGKAHDPAFRFRVDWRGAFLLLESSEEYIGNAK